MADKTIGELSKATELKDDDSFPIEQDGEPRRGTVGQLKDVAKSVAQPFADEAAKSAETAAEKAKDAADVALHPPKIQSGNWWTWDTAKNAYVDSGVDAGVSLTIAETVTGAPGDPAKVENVGTATDPKLKFTIPRGDPGQVQSVNGQTGDVETRALQFDISLPASAWASGSQTVADARFIDGGYDWDVDVKGACIPWNGITITAGQMVARADIVPVEDMTWVVTRREVRRDG